MSEVDRAATLFVTRPRAEAEPLCEALNAIGREAFAFPVLGIEPVADDAPLRAAMAAVAAYRTVIFVSPNAIRHAIGALDGPWPTGTSIGVMGPGSVATLRSLGVAATIVSPAARGVDDRPGFDSEGLFAALEAAIGIGHGFHGRVLIVRGSGGRGWLVERLRALGIAVDEVEAYRRVRPQPDATAASALRRVFASGAPACFVVTSSEGLDNLDVLVERSLDEVADAESARRWLRRATLLAPHRRIVEKAVRLGYGTIVACEGGDRGILAAIE